MSEELAQTIEPTIAQTEPEPHVEGQQDTQKAEPHMDPEQQAKIKRLIEKLDKEGKKIIPLPEIPEQVRIDLAGAVQMLEDLKTEIVAKKTEILERNDVVQQIAQELIQSKKINIDEQELEQSKQSGVKYSELLDNIIGDVDNEISYYSQFTGTEHPNYIIAWKQDPPHGVWFLMIKIKWIKKYIKTIRKDLQISFSRYTFGFDNQLKKLKTAQGFVKLHTQHNHEH